MKQLNVAIIGYGRSGRDIHTHLLRQLPDQFRIACIVDADAQRQAMIKAEVGCEVLTDYKQLFGRKDIDVVTNASFSDQHSPLSAELLRAGFHVLSEKPAGGTAEQFAQVQQAIAETGRTYSVFQQYRFSPSYVKIKELLSEKRLGRVIQISLIYSGFARRWDWQTAQGRSGGSLLNTGPHPVDQALELLGFPQDVQVFCAMDRSHTFGDAEDFVKLLLRVKGLPVVDIEISSSNKYTPYQYLIQGTHGCLKGDTQALEWVYYDEPEAPYQELDMVPLRNDKGEPQYCREPLKLQHSSWEIGAGIDNNNVKGLAYYRAWYDVLTKGEKPCVTPEQIALQLRVIDEAHKQNAETLDVFVHV